MPELNLQLILHSLTTLTAEVRALRDEVRGFRALREEISTLHAELRINTSALRQLDDLITMNVMDRLQALEATRDKS